MKEKKVTKGGRKGGRNLPDGQGTRHLTRTLVGRLHEPRPTARGDIDRLLGVVLDIIVDDRVGLVGGGAACLEVIAGDPCVSTGLRELVPGMHGPLGEALGELGHLGREEGGREGGREGEYVRRLL